MKVPYEMKPRLRSSIYYLQLDLESPSYGGAYRQQSMKLPIHPGELVFRQGGLIIIFIMSYMCFRTFKCESDPGKHFKSCLKTVRPLDWSISYQLWILNGIGNPLHYMCLQSLRTYQVLKNPWVANTLHEQICRFCRF